MKINVQSYVQHEADLKKLPRPAFLAHTRSVDSLVKSVYWGSIVVWIITIASFIAVWYFTVRYFAGGQLNYHVWSGEQWINAAIGTLIALSVSLVQAMLYSSGYRGWALIIGTAVMLFFSCFTELSSTLERNDEVVKTRSESSPLFEKALKNLDNSQQQAGTAVPNPYATDLADAEVKLAQCLKRLERKQEPHCDGAQRRVDSIQKQTDAFFEKSTSTQKDNYKNALDTAKALSYDEQNQYAVMRLMREFLGISALYAAFWFSLVVIATLEYSFHFAGGYVSDHIEALFLKGLDAKGRPINASKPETQQPTEAKPADPTQPTESKPADLKTEPSRPKDISFAGAVSAFSNDPTAHIHPALFPAFEGLATGLNQAHHARSQLYNNVAKAIGEIEKAWDDATTYPAKQAGKPILGTQEQQLRIPEVSTYRAELDAAGIPSPYDPVLDKSADKEAIQRIIARATPNPTDRPARPTEPTGRLPIEPTQPTDEQKRLKNAQAEIETLKAQNLAIKQQADREKAELEARAQAKAQADLKAKLEQVRAEREAKSRAEQAARERAEAEHQARLQAERERLEREKAAAEARAERERQAREQAERAAKAEAELKARAEELGRLTEEQVGLAADAIERAIKEGRVTTLGFESLKADLKAANLPTSSDSIRRLIKLGCQQLVGRGVVTPNPRAGVSGQPNFLIV